MSPRYRVTLTKEERKEFEAMTRRGKTRVLLLCNAGGNCPAWNGADVARALGITNRLIENHKKRFTEDGLEAALERKPREKPPRDQYFHPSFCLRRVWGLEDCMQEAAR